MIFRRLVIEKNFLYSEEIPINYSSISNKLSFDETTVYLVLGIYI